MLVKCLTGFGGGRSLLGVLLIAVLMLSHAPQTTAQTTQEFQPQTTTLQQTFTSSNWMSWASTAWSYFAASVGVNPTTGLHMANLQYACFTDWDLAAYILSIIFAFKLGLITMNGAWQFNDRITKVLTFLMQRPLLGSQTNGTPSDFYSSAFNSTNQYQACTIGQNPNNPTSASDTGRLLGALSILETVTSAYNTEVTSILGRTTSTYDQFASTCCNGADYYGYLMAEGYRAFNYPGCCGVFSAINNYAGPFFSLDGQSLPEINTLSEPLNLEILINQPSTRFLDFANRVFTVQQFNYTQTLNLNAWSEGIYPPATYCVAYIYEWVLVQLNSIFQDWKLTGPGFVQEGTPGNCQGQPGQSGPPTNSPILVQTKTAFSYLAIYGSNAYTNALVNAVSALASSTGFGEATFQNGQSAVGLWNPTGSAGFYSDKTQEQVLEAAYRAITPRITSLSVVSGFTGDSSGSVLLAVGDISLNPHGSKPSGVNYQVGRDSTPLGFLSAMMANPQPTTFDTNPSFTGSTGRPIGSYSLILSIGGGDVNAVTNYYETTSTMGDRAPITYTQPNGVDTWTDRNGTLVFSVSHSTNAVPPGTSDVFTIQILQDTSNRLVVLMEGTTYTGSWAAAWYFKYVIFPHISSFPKGYYIVRWTDASSGTFADGIPDVGDSYQILAQGTT